ncbi:MAG: COP23 domain-containing protein [Cyanobacteria bacterium SID2]|nr:COP23 domain-containing protein [Cyanobacteria bacterium SID2]MBP0005673.1 COP23 domain-containing protein [Cyanobacteria bacterium SBC]
MSHLPLRSIVLRTFLACGLAYLFGSAASAQLPELPPSSESETPPAEPTSTLSPRFTCESIDGQYTVMYAPESQPGQRYPWATPTALGGGWTPERRCEEISRRLESYRPDGLLELGTGVENGYDIVCVTTQANPSCRIVLTVPPGQSPQQTRDLVFENIVLADSGTSTDAVTTLTGRGDDLEIVEDLLGLELPDGVSSNRSIRSSAWVDLRPFLDPSDGGTGAQLTETSTDSTTPASGNPRLNPENFR